FFFFFGCCFFLFGFGGCFCVWFCWCVFACGVGVVWVCGCCGFGWVGAWGGAVGWGGLGVCVCVCFGVVWVVCR
ncbi:hypothetical protein RA277_28105, partial [Pseudomonas syringae pv. tagetis]